MVYIHILLPTWVALTYAPLGLLLADAARRKC